jgi:hypothetical protein
LLLSLHVISESKIRPTLAELRDFSVIGRGKRAWRQVIRLEQVGLPCGRRAGILTSTINGG